MTVDPGYREGLGHLPLDRLALADHATLGTFQNAFTARIPAPRPRVWDALPAALRAYFGNPGARLLARGVGARDWKRSPRFAARAGETIPGFRVAAARPPEEILLEGRHRHAEYVLDLVLLEAGSGSTSFTVATVADFPGLSGSVYRALAVMPWHRRAVEGLAATVARKASAR